MNILYGSFVIWPATKLAPIISDDFPVLMLAILDKGMRIMFIIGAPIVAVMFVAEFALAIVSRFAPQLQVFILAMPIKSLLAIFMLIFYFSTLLPMASVWRPIFTATRSGSMRFCVSEKSIPTPTQSREIP